MTREDLERWFEYHPPKSAHQAETYIHLRKSALAFAIEVANNTPSGNDQWIAITHIRSAIMWANAALACALAEDPGEQRP